MESLRTRDRWLPLPKHMADDAEDPQRVVLPEEMSELVQPLASHKSVIANLVTACFILLKMPILPFRHFVAYQLGIHKCHYYLDSLEIVLSSLFMAHHFEDCKLISFTCLMTVILTTIIMYSYSHCFQQTLAKKKQVMHCW